MISHKFESKLFLKNQKILQYSVLCINGIYVNRYLRKIYEIETLILIFQTWRYIERMLAVYSPSRLKNERLRPLSCGIEDGRTERM